MTNYDKLTYSFIYDQYVTQRKSWRQIANENNVSDALLLHRARTYGITSRTISQIRSEINDINLDDISELYAKGYSISSLAKQYKVAYSVMRDKLLSAGVVLRKSASARSISNGHIDIWKWANRPWLTAAYAIASTTAIAKHIGCSRTLIRKSMISLGIQFRQNLGPASGHSSNPVFPPFWVPNDVEVREAFEANDLARFELIEAAEIALCAYFSLIVKNVPLQRTGPTFTQLSEASRRKWADIEYVEKVTQANKLKYDDPEYAQYIAKQRLKQRTAISSIQQRLYDILDTIGVKYIRESSETVFGHYSFDCRIDNYHRDNNLLIEVQGDYWHNLERVVNNDRKKFTFITKYFPKFHLMYIWESEFDNIEILVNRIKAKLGLLLDAEYDFSELQIRTVDIDEAKRFLDAYHYIGGNRCGTAYAAFLNEEIVAMALFTSPTRQNMVGRYGNMSILELSRMCINPIYRKKNLASWFLSKVINMVQCDKIIAFADSTVGHIGTIYKAANFKLDHRVSPDYWYANGQCIYHKKTVYNRAKAMLMSENEYATRFGYIKVFGGEKLAYVYVK